MLLVHILSWVLSLVLFVALILTNNAKFTKIGSMIIRTTYILIIVTGAILCFITSTFSIPLVIKILGSFWIFYAYEMILVKKKRENTIKSTNLWIQFILAWIVVYISAHMI